jgi:dTDP-4-amino-4,6-dideoxygalactose transaminase
MDRVKLTDLLAHRNRIGDRIDAAIAEAVTGGRWIMGPQVAELEARLGEFCGAAHVVTCSNGTDALKLAVLALGLAPGDAVLCPTFTFTATAEVIALLGGVPVFVDCEPDGFNCDPASVAEAVRAARGVGLRPVGLIAVDLFGVTADHPALRSLCEREGLWLLDDGAQAFGATLDGAAIGTLAPVTATSFFPAKPLGCYGDGGALFTDDADLAATVRSLRVHGQGSDKYDNPRVGLNARLDTIQAAVLLAKLAIFDDELERRCTVAETYEKGLSEVVATPRVPTGCRPSWAQYTVRIDGGRRDAVRAHLDAAGIDSAVYYPRPLHLQPAYASGAGARLVDLALSERLAGEVLSLPMHPYLTDGEVERVLVAMTSADADISKRR